MKKISYFFMVTFLMSCASTSFYQLYTVQPASHGLSDLETIVYEDQNCSLSYDFWAPGGAVIFDFYNKTDQNISINLGHSFFILNGYAQDYCQLKTICSVPASTTSTVSSSLFTLPTFSASTVPHQPSAKQTKAYLATQGEVVVIPAHCYKVLGRFDISDEIQRNCELFRYPHKSVETSEYSLESSPLVFRNDIEYFVDGVATLIQNEFFVSSISNYPSDIFTAYRSEEYCGQKSYNRVKYFKYASPKNFYNSYVRSSSDFVY